MLFEQALAAMREGKKVRYVGANEHWFLRIEGWRIVNQEGNEFPLNSASIVNYDWEIVEEPKWEPEGGEWYVKPDGTVSKATAYLKEKNFGTERPTKEQAEKARDKMRVFNRLLAYVDEHAPDYDPDKERINWYVYWDRQNEVWSVDTNRIYETAGCVYMPKEVAKQLVDDLNSGRVVL